MLAREISKIHETFLRDKVDNLQDFKDRIKGELTVVISEQIIKTQNIDEDKIVNKAKKYLKKI